MATQKPRVVVYLDDDIKIKIEKLASKANRSVSNYLATLATREVEQAEADGVLHAD